jgi:hypothetical protein
MWRRLRHPEPPPKSFGYEFDSKDAKEGRAEAFPVYLQIFVSWRLERSGRCDVGLTQKNGSSSFLADEDF